MKHQFLPLPLSLARRGPSLPAASDHLPTPSIGARNGRSFLPEGSRQILELSDIEARSLPARRPTMGRADAVWQSVLRFFIEGFSLYGASVHWVATTAVTTIANEVDARQRQKSTSSERQESVSLASLHARAEITLVERAGAADRTAFQTWTPSTSGEFASPAREVDRYELDQPGWPAVIWRTVAGGWARWRREREIKKAVAALAEQDDRMLRDMGILHRSRIERILRYGRDD
jgi:hypothetical protein